MFEDLVKEFRHNSKACFEPLKYDGKYKSLFIYYFHMFIMLPDVYEYALNHSSQNENLNALLHQFKEEQPVDFTAKFDEIVDQFRNDSDSYDAEDFFYDLLTNTGCSNFFKTNSRGSCITNVCNIPSNRNLGEFLSKEAFSTPKYLIFSRQISDEISFNWTPDSCEVVSNNRKLIYEVLFSVCGDDNNEVLLVKGEDSSYLIQTNDEIRRVDEDFWKVSRNRVWDILIYKILSVQTIGEDHPSTLRFLPRKRHLPKTPSSDNSVDKQNDTSRTRKFEHVSNNSDVPKRQDIKESKRYIHVFDVIEGIAPPIDEGKIPNPICRKLNKFSQAMSLIIKHNAFDQQDLFQMNYNIIREKVYNDIPEHNTFIDMLIKAFEEYYDMTDINDITTESILSFLQEKELCSFSMEDLKHKRAPQKKSPPPKETIETIMESYKTDTENFEEEEDGNEGYPAVNASKNASKRNELPDFLSDFNWREKADTYNISELVKELRLIHDYNPNLDISDLQGHDSLEIQPLYDLFADFETYSEDEDDGHEANENHEEEDICEGREEEEDIADDNQEEDNQEEEDDETEKEEEEIHEEGEKAKINKTRTKITKTQMILTVHEFFNSSYADVPDKKIKESLLEWKNNNKDRLIFDPTIKTLYAWRKQKKHPNKNKEPKEKKHRGGYRKPKVLTDEIFDCLLTISLAFPFLTARLKRLYLLDKVESCTKISIRTVQVAMTKMGFVKKKSHPFVYQRNSLGRIALRAFWARKVLKIFEDHGILPVFVDEASIQIQAGSKLIMGYKGTNLAQFEPAKHRHVSIIAAVVPSFGIAINLVYGSINQMKYKIFMKMLSDKLRKSVCESETNIIFINDNATIHKITDTKKDNMNEKTDLLFTIAYSPQTNAGVENLFSFIKGKIELLDSTKFIGMDENTLISKLKKELLKIISEESTKEMTIGWYANTVAQWKRCAQCLPLSTYKIPVDKSDNILNLDITTSREKRN